MSYSYDLQMIKENLSEDQIIELLTEFGGEPIKKNNNTIICRTICHNNRGEGSPKLYYYFNSGLFHCYTGCSEPSFDIFELTRKVMSREQPKAREDSMWNLPEAVAYVAEKFGFAPNDLIKEENNDIIKENLKVFSEYDRVKDIDITTQQIVLKEYDDTFLRHLPHNIPITPWINEGITQEVMNRSGICYNPKTHGIIIPHQDINNRLIGIRERTLIKDQAELYGKYMPARIAGVMFNHPLSYNLYNLNFSKENIKRIKKVFVFESEKSCMKYASYFGIENDISCAICGSSLIAYQVWLLIQLGAEEIIVGLDHDFTDINSEEAKKIIKNLKNIHKKYGNYVKISFLWDKENLLGLKSSPIDDGPDKFLYLYQNRISIYK